MKRGAAAAAMVLGLATAVAGACAGAVAPPQRVSQAETASGARPLAVPIATLPGAAGLKPFLRRWIAAYPHHGPQSFCAVGYRDPSGAGAPWARIRWIEGRRLVEWRRGWRAPAPNADLDLDKDVVPTRQDVGTSTFLVARPWVEAVAADCRAVGTVYRLGAG